MHLGNEFIRYDMSEYMEKHAVARLIGAPPGYVGFEQGGLLVDAVRTHPYSVVLLDEIEKAHPDIFNILLQVMDHATLTDNNGRKADFRQVVLIMTSNAGSREMSAGEHRLRGRPGRAASPTAGSAPRRRDRRPPSSGSSVPEFRNRLDAIVNFQPLTPRSWRRSSTSSSSSSRSSSPNGGSRSRCCRRRGQRLAEKGYDPVYGARPLARVIQTDVRDPPDRRNPLRRARERRHGRHRLDGGHLAFAYKGGRLRAGGLAPYIPASMMSDRTRDSRQGRRSPLVGARRRRCAPAEPHCDKPSYVEELERQAAEKDSLRAGVHREIPPGVQEFEDSRARAAQGSGEGRRTQPPRGPR